MKKTILFLFCILSLSNAFGSSKQYTSKDYYKAVRIAFYNIVDSNDITKKEHAENGLIRFYKEVPEFKEEIIRVYYEKKSEYEEQNNLEAKERLLKIGNKLGIE